VKRVSDHLSCTPDELAACGLAAQAFDALLIPLGLAGLLVFSNVVVRELLSFHNVAAPQQTYLVNNSKKVVRQGRTGGLQGCSTTKSYRTASKAMRWGRWYARLAARKKTASRLLFSHA
jgi:hypothetical protein